MGWLSEMVNQIENLQISHGNAVSVGHNTRRGNVRYRRTPSSLRVLTMRYLLGVIILSLVNIATNAKGQDPATSGLFTGHNSLYGAPGNYGTSYGTASYGMARTYSAFNSPYGAGYGYGYPTAGFIPNKYGVNLWRPGFVAPGYVYGAPTSYRTYPVRTWPTPTAYGPSIGVYAPSFGPSPFPTW